MSLYSNVLSKVQLFSKLSSNELSELEKIIHEENFQAGDILITEGTLGNELYILMSGEVGVYKKDSSGIELKLSIINKEGSFLGEMSLIDDKPRSATIRALTLSKVLKLKRNDFLKQITKDLSLKILSELSGKLRQFDDKYFKEILERNRELEKANEELKKLDQMKSDFVSLTSHELKTPLNLILSSSQLLFDVLDKSNISDVEKSCFKIIDTNVQRLNNTFNKIIQFIKSETKNIEVKKDPVNINDIIDDVVCEIKPFIEKRNQTLLIAKNDNLKSCHINREMVRQAILNIAMNAVKFTKDHGTITIKTYEANYNICVLIMDTGIGIPNNKLKNIFASFYDTANIDNHSSGTYEFMSKGLGIGLSIAKNFVEKNNGNIKVKSNEGQGSEFEIILPCIN
jgi:signal transduction histidine kinase